MNEEGYKAAFQKYEAARARYAELQTDIHAFLARFTGDPKLAEAPFLLRDLARMEGMRRQRDLAFDTYRDLEKAVFDRLSRRWDDQPG